MMGCTESKFKKPAETLRWLVFALKKEWKVYGECRADDLVMFF